MSISVGRYDIYSKRSPLADKNEEAWLSGELGSLVAVCFHTGRTFTVTDDDSFYFYTPHSSERHPEIQHSHSGRLAHGENIWSEMRGKGKIFDLDLHIIAHNGSNIMEQLLYLVCNTMEERGSSLIIRRFICSLDAWGPKAKVGGAKFRKLFTEKQAKHTETVLNRHFTSTLKH